MSIRSSGAITGGFNGMLRAVAVPTVVAGAAGSVGLTLWAGHRNPSRLLLVVFAIWVLSPFMALLWANIVSRRWPVITQTTLHCLMLVLPLSSLIVYGDIVLRPPKLTAFRFLVLPLGSWLLMAIVLPLAAFISGRHVRRQEQVTDQSGDRARTF